MILSALEVLDFPVPTKEVNDGANDQVAGIESITLNELNRGPLHLS